MDETFVKKDEQTLQKQAKEMVQSTMNKMQHELKVDVAGFGTSLRIQHPAVWRKVKGDWEEIFTKLPVTYEMKVKIEEYGASGITSE